MTYFTSTSPLPFEWQGFQTRVIFGAGTRLAASEESARLGMQRVLIVHGRQHADVAREIAAGLGERYAGSFCGARMHTPVTVTEDALDVFAHVNADGVIAIGGGTATGLSKALALRTDAPQIILPTTYAGSEMTPILGETQDDVKTTLRDPKVLPETVIYDVDLTVDLPVKFSGVSGMNAVAHAVEALYARDANPLISALALHGTRALVKALPALKHSGTDRAARTEALYGSWLAGICLGAVSMGLHHKLCHTLGGLFNLPHAETHSILLPHALAYNAPAIPVVMEQLSATLNVPDVPGELFDINRAIDAPRGLRDIGMPEGYVERAVDQALSNPYWNPRTLSRDGLIELISRAYRGERPAATGA